ncbi:MAG: hypothetical protein V4489_04225 [Chlamydiota bacterium]
MNINNYTKNTPPPAPIKHSNLVEKRERLKQTIRKLELFSKLVKEQVHVNQLPFPHTPPHVKPWVCEVLNAMTELSNSEKKSVEIFQEIEERYLKAVGDKVSYPFIRVFDTADFLQDPPRVKKIKAKVQRELDKTIQLTQDRKKARLLINSPYY